MLDDLNSKQQKTLLDIFTNPLKSDIPWKNIETLFVALGGEVSQGRGSRVRVIINGVRAVFHQPHPQREAPKGTVKGVRDFLKSAGISDSSDLFPEDEDI
ncbi:type II toxin-antitoxin system HicA family toxin [Chamaesiphon sp. OTE_75_metabat_556]|uniref:type II toxin-antitoxin system HicA family toxin n=1 Tax=Chamaesiphon sp. OTE_75_metabat_556 TaxID=2964692 RepID=UPI00286D28CF|nr:type II toxin-antitoxin system HicA family toxin [Chamaesiphon sp. OTE_75_metabat_556]